MSSALAVAKCFFDLRKQDDGRDLGFVRIHKLVYFAHGLYLTESDEPLIGEQLEAWQWGPIFPSLYHVLFGQDVSEIMANAPSITDDHHRTFIEGVAASFRGFDTLTLSTVAHLKGSPWYNAVTKATSNPDVSVDYLRHNLPRGVVITQGAVQAYFKDMLKEGARLLEERGRGGKEESS